MTQDQRTLRDFQRTMGDGAARLGEYYGLSPILGRTWGVLMASPQPVSLDELAQLVGAAKSSTSVAVRRLESARVVRRVRQKGDRRDHWVAVTDPAAILRDWLHTFIEREVASGLALLDVADTLLADADPDSFGPDGLDIVKKRVRNFRLATLAVKRTVQAILRGQGLFGDGGKRQSTDEDTGLVSRGAALAASAFSGLIGFGQPSERDD